MTDEIDEWAVIVKDSNGTLLTEGDAVVLIKDLKVKGALVVLFAEQLQQPHQ